MTTIAIACLTSFDELYCAYPGQTSPQDCYVELDPKTGALTASYNGEIGNAVPMLVWHNRIFRWAIPCLTADVANSLLEEIAPLCQQICDGYSEEWDGSNLVGKIDADATEAHRAVAEACDRGWDEHELVQIYSADQWYGGLGSVEQQARELGIGEETTDEEFEEIVNAEINAVDAGTVVSGQREHLEWIRRQVA